MRKERKHHSTEEKVAILRRHLLDKMPERLGLAPSTASENGHNLRSGRFLCDPHQQAELRERSTSTKTFSSIRRRRLRPRQMVPESRKLFAAARRVFTARDSNMFAHRAQRCPDIPSALRLDLHVPHRRECARLASNAEPYARSFCST